ncbi:MAG: NAD(P)H-binding protein [Gammaproteobacteria bacterium]|nr:NAD(P)H-binding protein [Gammaproteobacteria bacterium]
MRVAIIGGTGFVGGYLVDALLDKGHRVTALVRPGSEGKLIPNDCIRKVSGDLSDRDALRQTLEGAGAVIYNVGLLREFPSRGITFEATQYQGVVDTIAAAKSAGVKRLLLMSAIGVKDPGTKYQSTKRRAELHALASGLDVTILRPSVIFGDPRGTMEFATQLYRDMVRPPMPAVEFAGVQMSPVHIEDVADAFVAALHDDATSGEVIELAGPEVLSWRDMVERIAGAAGRSKLILPMPLWVMRTGATLFDWLPFYPVTRDQLTMLSEGNTAPVDALEGLIDRPARAFDETNLAYLGH